MRNVHTEITSRMDPMKHQSDMTLEDWVEFWETRMFMTYVHRLIENETYNSLWLRKQLSY